MSGLPYLQQRLGRPNSCSDSGDLQAALSRRAPARPLSAAKPSFRTQVIACVGTAEFHNGPRPTFAGEIGLRGAVPISPGQPGRSACPPGPGDSRHARLALSAGLPGGLANRAGERDRRLRRFLCRNPFSLSLPLSSQDHPRAGGWPVGACGKPPARGHERALVVLSRLPYTTSPVVDHCFSGDALAIFCFTSRRASGSTLAGYRLRLRLHQGGADDAGRRIQAARARWRSFVV